MEKEIYAIYYDNGETYADAWVGILEAEGCYSDPIMAEERVKQLQIAHDLRIKLEIEDGYMFPVREDERWKVVPIKLHQKDIPQLNEGIITELNES